MSAIFAIFLHIIEKEKSTMERLNRKRPRDCSNRFELPEQFISFCLLRSTFLFNKICMYVHMYLSCIAYFRLNKDAFKLVLEETSPFAKRNSIPIILQLATALRFFGQGSAQQMIGKDSNLALGRITVSKTLTNMLNILESVLCPKWIKFERTNKDLISSKRHFYEKFQIPGIIGCIDGTHVKIKAPCKDSHLFYNREGYFSLNAMIH